MKRLRTWWREMGGLLAACVLAVLVTTPVFDALVCANEEAPAASATFTNATAAKIAAPATDQQAPGHPADADGGCQHGHCHHGAPMLGALIGDEAAPVVARSSHPALSARAAPSLAVAGPDRPPRA